MSTSRYFLRVQDAPGQPCRSYDHDASLQDAKLLASEWCWNGYIGGSVEIVDAFKPDGHPDRIVARFVRDGRDGVVEVNP